MVLRCPVCASDVSPLSQHLERLHRFAPMLAAEVEYSIALQVVGALSDEEVRELLEHACELV